MAKPYFEKLATLVEKCDLGIAQGVDIEVKHFFSGAAVYSKGVICVSLSPMGLAFKLPQEEVAKLIKSGEAVPLKYFEKGNVKHGYAMFQNPNLNRIKHWRGYLVSTLAYTLHEDT